MHTLNRLDEGRMSIIGHRGASAYAQENTAEAYRLAQQQGADAVEIDVRRTADGGMVIHHDPQIEGVGTIVEHGFDELRTRVPWLLDIDEMFDAAEGMWVNVEIKNNPGDPDYDESDQVAEEVVRWVQRRAAHDRVLVSCFNPHTIETVRRLDPSIATGWLTTVHLDPLQTIGPAAAKVHRAIHPHVSMLTDETLESLIPAVKDAGLWVLTWTIDDPAVIRRLSDAGVTGVFTNDPAGALVAIGG